MRMTCPGLLALALAVTTCGATFSCGATHGLCDCIASSHVADAHTVSTSADYKVLDVPASCTLEWIPAKTAKGVADAVDTAAARTPSMQLVMVGVQDEENYICRVRFENKADVHYYHPDRDDWESLEYHHTEKFFSTDASQYVGRLSNAREDWPTQCFFGIPHADASAGGEQYRAQRFELLAASCENADAVTWRAPDLVQGRTFTSGQYRDEHPSPSHPSFCGIQAICTVEPPGGGAMQPGYARGGDRTKACAAFCDGTDCSGVCAWCSACASEDVPAEPCVAVETTTTAAPTAEDEGLDLSDSSAIAAVSVCVAAGLAA